MDRQEKMKWYKNKKWIEARKMVLVRDNGLCQICLKKKILKTGNIVHHIIEIDDDIEKAYELDNLLTVCRECHEEIHPDKECWLPRKENKITVYLTIPGAEYNITTSDPSAYVIDLPKMVDNIVRLSWNVRDRLLQAFRRSILDVIPYTNYTELIIIDNYNHDDYTMFNNLKVYHNNNYNIEDVYNELRQDGKGFWIQGIDKYLESFNSNNVIQVYK